MQQKQVYTEYQSSQNPQMNLYEGSAGLVGKPAAAAADCIVSV